MKRLPWWIFVCALGGMFAGATAAAEMRASTSAVRKEVIAVIETQLGCFRKGDVTGAFALASAALRAQRSQSDFARSVKSGYPEIWSNTRAEFGVVRDVEGQAAVVVQVYSKTGSAAYDYTLVREAKGWRINGVLRHAAKREKA